ncbi:MAG: hypothetical protein WCO02_18570 [Bacteroidota bacterium]
MNIKTRKALQKETDLRLFIYNEAISGNYEALSKMNSINEIEQQICDLEKCKRNRDPLWRRDPYYQKGIYQDLRNLEIQKRYLLRTFDVQKCKARKYLAELKQKSKSESNT